MPDPIALVVDDEPLILMDTADIIAAAGYQVLEARSADEALRLLAQDDVITVVVTDIQMPGEMDGLALARCIGERWPDIHIVIASGAVTPKPDEMPNGARFIGKPLDQAVIIEALRNMTSMSAS